MASASELRRTVRNYLYSNYPELRPGKVYTCCPEPTLTQLRFPEASHNKLSSDDVIEIESTGEQISLIQQTAGPTQQVPHGVTTDETRPYYFWQTERAINDTIEQPIPDNADIAALHNPRFTSYQIDEAIISALDMLEVEAVHSWGHICFEPKDTPIRIPGLMDIMSIYYLDGRSGGLIPYPFREWGQSGLPPDVIVNEVATRLPDRTFYLTYAKKIVVPEDLLSRQRWLIAPGAVSTLLAQSVAPATADPGRRTDTNLRSGQELRDSLNLADIFTNGCRKEAQLLRVEGQKQPGTIMTESYERYVA